MIRLRRHPREQELLDYYYGDRRTPSVLQEHLDRCARCAAAYSALVVDLERLAELRTQGFQTSEEPGFWEAQAAGVQRRLVASSRQEEGRLKRWVIARSWPTKRRGLGFAALLATAVALALLTWAPWRVSTPPPVSVFQEDQVDDQLLREIDALLEAPLGSGGLAGQGWAGSTVPTL